MSKQKEEQSFGEMLTEDIKKNGKLTDDSVEIKGIGWKVDLNIRPEEKSILTLPKENKLISEFAEELAHELKDRDYLFFRPDANDIVEIRKIRLHKNDEELYTGFEEIKPNRFITMVENFIIPGYDVWNDKHKEWEFKKKSLGRELSATLLQSQIIHQSLPQINRIFNTPLPILYNGVLTFPKRGYDKRFGSWLPHNAPEIENDKMSIEEAKEVIIEIFKEFCFQDKQDYTNAVAGLLTPFLKGLYPSFNTRAPVFFYIANRERAGKDYLAGITGIVYEGNALEEAPISTSENAKSNNTEELRKKLLSAMIRGRKRMHFANNKGYINNAVFEGVATSMVWTDRMLGRNEEAQFDNEIDFSLSGNVGVGFTPDFANRCRFIRLFLDIEDANARSFDKPDLHRYVLNNRPKVLSALYALVRNWIEQGMPKGEGKFTSFPQWAEVCGGIMEAAGYESPCNPDKETLSLGGDSETQDMKLLFELCYDKCKDEWVDKSTVKSIVLNSDVPLFSYIDFEKRSGQVSFGNKLTKFVGRVLSDIRLVVNNSNTRSSRQLLKFTKLEENTAKNIFEFAKGSHNHGNLKKDLCVNGNVGNSKPQFKQNKSNNMLGGVDCIPRLPRLPEGIKDEDIHPELKKELDALK